MTNLEYKILTYIKEKSEIHWIDLLNDFHPDFSYQDTGAVTQILLDRGLLENLSPATPPPLCQLRLSDKGRITLLSEEDRLRREESLRQENMRREQAQEQQRLDQIVADKADRKAERRADRIFQIFLAFLNYLIPFILGGLAEHLTGFVDRILQFFK